jgi:energy-coupling factor transporter ATP-binding protein EcfA2
MTRASSAPVGASHQKRLQVSRKREPGELPVELAELSVTGLFGRFDHVVAFPHAQEGAADPSLVILHGQNGVGKTTVLLMLDGLMRLDFDVFRVRPFSTCTLSFSSGDVLRVEKTSDDAALFVTFRKHRVELHPRDKGPLHPSDAARVDLFREEFLLSTADIRFELITTARAPFRDEVRETYAAEYEAYAARHQPETPEARLQTRLRGRRGPSVGGAAIAVRRFITEAQVDYRQFFRAEPDLFSRIFEVVRADEPPPFEPPDLVKRANKIAELDKLHTRLGLQPDYWQRDELVRYLKTAKAEQSWALAAVGAYLEGLETRAQERQLVAERLLTFERIVNKFFSGKQVRVGPQYGFRIEASDGAALSEDHLSSGEFHLLYLMVTALVARRRGTVIAIDEPELSMHVSWQRRLIKSLVEVASHARPQFVLATHSPDVVAGYREFMTRLGPS